MLGFVRSYVTMRYLGFYEVGLIAMIQSIVEFVSMLQMGLLNGGFRMYFVNTKSVNKKINAMIFSYFGFLLTLIMLLAFVLYFYFKPEVNIETGIILLGGVIGVFALAKNWISNLLIAEQRLNVLNSLNIWSTLLSFLFIFLVPNYGLIGCILLIVSQPILFIIFALLKNSHFRPTCLVFNKSLLRKMWVFGLIPFIAGILVKVDDQVERWGIINTMGIETLGKYNLVLIYCSIFMLVPASINPIFFPTAILQYKENDIKAVKITIKRYAIILLGYTLIAFLATALFLPYFVELLLPNYIIGIPYLWYILPYLLIQILIMPLDFIYTITAKYKIMFFSYSIAVIIFILLVLYISSFNEIKLEYFPIAKGIDGICFFVISYICYYFFFLRKGRKSIFS